MGKEKATANTVKDSTGKKPRKSYSKGYSKYRYRKGYGYRYAYRYPYYPRGH